MTTESVRNMKDYMGVIAHDAEGQEVFMPLSVFSTWYGGYCMEMKDAKGKPLVMGFRGLRKEGEYGFIINDNLAVQGHIPEYIVLGYTKDSKAGGIATSYGALQAPIHQVPRYNYDRSSFEVFWMIDEEALVELGVYAFRVVLDYKAIMSDYPNAEKLVMAMEVQVQSGGVGDSLFTWEAMKLKNARIKDLKIFHEPAPATYRKLEGGEVVSRVTSTLPVPQGMFSPSCSCELTFDTATEELSFTKHEYYLGHRSL